MLSKHDRFGKLVDYFKAYTFEDNQLVNPYSIQQAKLQGDYISPWNLWHGSLDAKVLLVGQDFSNVEYFVRNAQSAWQPEKDSPTNRALMDLFDILGYKIGLPGVDGRKDAGLFFTNAILGVKEGGMNAPVKARWYKETSSFLKETINIIKPKVIIAMGTTAYKAIFHAYGIRPDLSFKQAVGTGEAMPDGTILFVVAHCSALGRVNRNFDLQKKDWEILRDLLEASNQE